MITVLCFSDWNDWQHLGGIHTAKVLSTTANLTETSPWKKYERRPCEGQSKLCVVNRSAGWLQIRIWTLGWTLATMLLPVLHTDAMPTYGQSSPDWNASCGSKSCPIINFSWEYIVVLYVHCKLIMMSTIYRALKITWAYLKSIEFLLTADIVFSFLRTLCKLLV